MNVILIKLFIYVDEVDGQYIYIHTNLEKNQKETKGCPTILALSAVFTFTRKSCKDYEPACRMIHVIRAKPSPGSPG